MSRIAETFTRLRACKRTALIPFLTAGDPQPELTLPLMQALVAAGADLIELGVPFSDPMADGPTIQRASERALRHGMGLARVCALVAEFRRANRETPVVLMGYLNPFEAFGWERFVALARDAGVDGVLVVDLPPEEAEPYVPALRQAGLDPILLVAPTTPLERARAIAALGSGFLYYVSLTGVTGAQHFDPQRVRSQVAELRAAVALPVAVGFGVRDPVAAAALAGIADGVVLGSRLIEAIEKTPQEEACRAAAQLIAAFRSALDRGIGESGS